MSTAPALTASTLRCAGCGASPAPDAAFPFQCPNLGRDGADHVLVRTLDRGARFGPVDDREPNPFVRYRTRLHSYHRARSGGIPDDTFVEMVRRLDARVAEADGRGFRVTPFARRSRLSTALGFEPGGGIWVKDETGNVSGSHKARHLMGILLHLEVSEMLGLADPHDRPVLAVASCGNAALAAAVLAAAAGRRLQVFVPVDADPAVLARLRALDSEVCVCERRAGQTGDPCYVRLREALAEGALPFTCQGDLNGLAIEGGETLAYEMANAMQATGTHMDHLIVQVGGGALASSCTQALEEALSLGEIRVRPRMHTVQTEGVHPLERAYRRFVADMGRRERSEELEAFLQRAARHRSRYMWPWEAAASSVATGILDDEAYDWLAVVGGMLRSGGLSVVVGESALRRAHELGGRCGFEADPTGTSGLAGLSELLSRGVVGPGQRVALLFTGVERS